MPYTVDNHIYDDGGGTARYNCGVPVVALNTPQVYEVQNAAGSWVNLLNGVSQSSSASNTVGLAAAPQIGGNSVGGVYYYGDWAEMVLYNRILSSVERQSLVNYFNGRYGLGAV